MKIQGLILDIGDRFQLGDDSSVYTFRAVVHNERFNFQELICGNEFGGESAFRIDTMFSEQLDITKL
tara:strand:- start:46 stop:246 length:201 start_codon:yes stop_codon:yes gene_type:complete